MNDKGNRDSMPGKSYYKLFLPVILFVSTVVLSSGCGGGEKVLPDLQIHNCGNGIIEYSEQCDDGNRTNNDGCSSDCKIGFSKIFGGGSIRNVISSIQQTNDGGYIASGFYGSEIYFWVIKLDEKGEEKWSKLFGGNLSDIAYSVQQTEDGGYVVSGYTYSYSIAGNYDFWIIKLDNSGNEEWDKIYGGTGNDVAYSIQQTADRGYIVAGPNSIGTGNSDYWIVKLNNNGEKEWDETYGYESDDVATSVGKTTDGGYVVAGYSNYLNTDKYDYDYWIIKLNSSGEKEWDYYEVPSSWANSVQQTLDGGYVVAGSILGDFGIVKLDASGNKKWSKKYGGDYDEEAYAIQQTADRGYILAGYKISDRSGDRDCWLVKLNSNGDKEWDNTYGGEEREEALSVFQTADGGFVVGGYTESYSVSGHDDAWVLKLDSEGNCNGCVFE